MDHFTYKNNSYYAEDVPLEEIITAIDTPFYCYSTATLLRHVQVFWDSIKPLPAKICYAVKANNNLAVLKTLANAGVGADVVSAGEIRYALAAGMAASDIVFSGVAKTAEEMRFALNTGIFQFNIESENELRQLSAVATSLGATAPVAVRVNPDVVAGTHAKISTGHKESKFGIPMTEARGVYRLAATLPGIRIQGVSMHIGSQLTTLAPFQEAFTHLREFVLALRGDGHTITTVDVGGGLGVPYGKEAPPLPADYATIVKATTHDLGCTAIFEPGRLIAANAGILVSRVIYTKQAGGRHFLMIDAGMNDLMRPALYGAHHDIIPLHPSSGKGGIVNYDIVGPVCETGDIFAKQRPLPPMHPGEVVIIRSAGAYGAVMASTYNARPLIPEVMVNGDQFAVTRPRQTYEAMLAQYTMPDWLS